MSETITEPTPGSVQEPAPVVPEGFVPKAEIDKAREEARRGYQSELDKAKDELARLKAAAVPATPAAPTTESGDFDPGAFRRSLLRDVMGAATLSQTAAELKAEFVHADPGLFSPEKLSEFSSVEALRFAVQDSHARVAAIVDAEKAAVEAKVREELVPGSTTPPGGDLKPAPAAGGDPTPAELAAMSIDELNKLDQAVVDRVMAKALGA